jgi:hypothetical protein
MTATDGILELAAAAAAAADLGVASARKRGSRPGLPYVPVVERLTPQGATRTYNPARGLAYATRAEAVARAQRHIDVERRVLAEQLATPRYRALREAHGLPRELPR